MTILEMWKKALMHSIFSWALKLSKLSVCISFFNLSFSLCFHIKHKVLLGLKPAFSVILMLFCCLTNCIIGHTFLTWLWLKKGTEQSAVWLRTDRCTPIFTFMGHSEWIDRYAQTDMSISCAFSPLPDTPSPAPDKQFHVQHNHQHG